MGEVWWEGWGRRRLMGLGDRMVEVMIKNMRRKKMKWVIEEMVKVGDILCVVFKGIGDYF